MDNEKYERYRENKNHTPVDFPYNTYLCSIPGDFSSVKLHWHDEIEIVVIKKGGGTVSVDLVRYDVGAGDAVFIFPGQLHSIEQRGGLFMEYENILFKPELLKSSGIDLCTDNFLHKLFGGTAKIEPVARSAETAAIISEIDELCGERPYGYQLAVKGNLFRLMFGLVNGCPDADIKGVNPKILEKMKTVLTYIKENYRCPITIEEIAGKVFYSRSYFMKFFKDATGKGFIEYLNDYRLAAAAEQLRTSDSNIIDIASSVGFDNLSYFNRSFKQRYGVAPGEYRKKV